MPKLRRLLDWWAAAKITRATAAAAPPYARTAAEEAFARAAAADPSVRIARGTIALIAGEQACAFIVADQAGAKTVLLRPTPHHHVKSRCKAGKVWLASMDQVVEKLGG